ncbi:flagellar basal body rod C-terminal domain-containing protein [Achromobacter xylosoxidans]
MQLNEEIVNLMVAQRAYEANAKIVQASDDMLGLVNNLRR